MPNEEPEGPNLPPKRTSSNDKSILSLTAIKESKYIELKGIIGAIAAAFIMISYVVYYFTYYETGEKLNELYFISSGIGISVFTGLLFTFFENIYVKTILLFTSVFYAILEMIYIVIWVIQGQPYAYIKLSLFAGLIIGICYFLYDKFTNKPRHVG